MSISIRIREERQRLGLTQAEFAALAGASQRSQMGWEHKRSYPDARILEAWHAAGVDACYIVTSLRTDPTIRSNVLTAPELALIENYRQSNDYCKKVIEGAGLSAFCATHNLPAPRISASAIFSVDQEAAVSQRQKT